MSVKLANRTTAVIGFLPILSAYLLPYPYNILKFDLGPALPWR